MARFYVFACSMFLWANVALGADLCNANHVPFSPLYAEAKKQLRLEGLFTQTIDETYTPAFEIALSKYERLLSVVSLSPTMDHGQTIEDLIARFRTSESLLSETKYLVPTSFGPMIISHFHPSTTPNEGTHIRVHYRDKVYVGVSGACQAIARSDIVNPRPGQIPTFGSGSSSGSVVFAWVGKKVAVTANGIFATYQ